MAVEVVLIQKYALLIGSSLYSVSTVLVTLLVSSGIGSRCSRSISEHVAFRTIAIWILVEALLFPFVVAAVGGYGLAIRILVAAVLIFPLGFFMGIPFPKGTLRVGPLIDWGFAVNGAASVLGSVIVLMIALSQGFTLALLFAAVMYLLAYALYCAKESWA